MRSGCFYFGRLAFHWRQIREARAKLIIKDKDRLATFGKLFLALTECGKKSMLDEEAPIHGRQGKNESKRVVPFTGPDGFMRAPRACSFVEAGINPSFDTEQLATYKELAEGPAEKREDGSGDGITTTTATSTWTTEIVFGSGLPTRVMPKWSMPREFRLWSL